MALTLPDTSAWLAEDVGSGDVTSTRALRRGRDLHGRIVLVKEPGVVCGLEVAAAVFAELGVALEPLVAEGDDGRARHDRRGRRPGARRAHGRAARAQPHRAALGIATLTRRYVDAVDGHGRRRSSTRARRRPACAPSRSTRSRAAAGRTTDSGSTTAMLIKDNHLRLAGGVAAAVAAPARTQPVCPSRWRRRRSIRCARRSTPAPTRSCSTT